ncbi:MAG: hypothetical protein Q8N77_03825 [Nanoarchaeota archaeon]|nr:hypothetical protein [Nanoarchaeota archaeon]
MKLEEMFWHETEKKMAEEIIKKLKTTNARKGIKKPDMEIYLRDTLQTTYIFHCIEWVINKLREEKYVKRKKFTLKDFKEDLKERHYPPLEIPRYYLTRKGERLYNKIC